MHHVTSINFGDMKRGCFILKSFLLILVLSIGISAKGQLQIVKILAIDGDNDGQFGTIEIEFNEAVNDISFSNAAALLDWHVSSDSFKTEDISPDVFSTEVYVLGGGSTANDKYIRYTFPEIATTGGLWYRYDRDGGINDAAHDLTANDTLQNIPVTLASDSAKPVFVSATAISSTIIEIQYTEKVVATFSNASNWSVSGATSVNAYTHSTDSTIIILQVDYLSTDYTGSLSLTINGTDQIADLFGNRASNISGQAITDGQAPEFSSSSGIDKDNSGINNLSQGDEITMAFSEDLASGSQSAITAIIQSNDAFGTSGNRASVSWNDAHTMVITMGGGFTINLSGTFSLNSSSVYDDASNEPAVNVLLQMPASLEDITPPTADGTTPFAWQINNIPNNEYINAGDIFELKFSEAMLNGSNQTSIAIENEVASDLGISADSISVSTIDNITFEIEYTGSIPYALLNGKTISFASGSLTDLNGVASNTVINFSITDPDNTGPVFIEFFVSSIIGNNVYYSLVFSEPVWFDGMIEHTDIDIIYGTSTIKNLRSSSLVITKSNANDTITFYSHDAPVPVDGQQIRLYIKSTGFLKVKDASYNENPLTGIVDVAITFNDGTPPDNQDAVFPNSIITKGESVISINSSGDVNNSVWLALSDPVTRQYSDTMTTAGGLSTNIITPKEEGVYHLYVVDASGNTSAASIAILVIDNTPPIVSSVSIPNVTMRVGDSVVATINVISDTTEYRTISGTIGGFPLKYLTKVADDEYNASFIIIDGGSSVAAGSNIPVNFTVTDSAGNISSAYTTAIVQGSDPIYANNPTAVISGNSTICSGDSATLTVLLTGAAPWSITVDGGPSSITKNNIPTSPYYFKVAPKTSGPYTYTVSNVTDQSLLSQAGTGSGIVNVLVLPVVNITNPASSRTYATTSAVDTLTGTPAGGIFSGDGVVPSNNTFHPDQAGLGDHDIIYSYTNTTTTCTNRDTVTVTVSDAVAQIHINNPNLISCHEESPFIITGDNDYSVPGIFEIQVSGVYYPTGQGLENTGIDEATIYPQQLGNGVYTIRYHYDTVPNAYDVSASIEIIEVSTPIISGIKNRCIDGDTINLLASNLTPVGGTGNFSYDGPGGGLVTSSLVNNGNTAILYPDQMGEGTYTVEYYYESPEGCHSDTLDNLVTIYPLPSVTFTSKELYNAEETASLLTGSPSGGTFSGGAYISGNYFDPSIAGTGTKSITYTYTNPTTQCTDDSTRTVEVERASGSINGIDVSKLYCFNAETDTFTGVPSNSDGTPGSFTLFTGLTITGTNQVAFNPEIAGGEPSGGTKEHVISFNYTGWDGVTPFTLRDTILVDYIPTVNFSGLDDAYCVNDNEAHDLIGNSPTLGTGLFLTSPGLSVNGDRAKLYPYLADSTNTQITYQFESSSGCIRDTSMSFTINPLPVVDFNIRSTFSWKEPPIPLSGTGIPAGGYFTGEGGITYGSPDTTFNPGFEGGPIANVEITYTYTDLNSCTNFISKEVDIIEQTATIEALHSPNYQYCLNDEIDTIIAIPNDNQPGGYFDTIAGILYNIGEDTAIFNPQSSGSHEIVYHFVDINGAPFEVITNLSVDVVRNPIFQNIDNNEEFCQNHEAVEIITNDDETLTPSYQLNSSPLTSEIFAPSAGNIGNNSLRCTFTKTSTGCTSTSTVNVIVRAVPEIDFTASDNCVNEAFPDSIQFINNTTLASSDSIIMWVWNFDDVNSGIANIDSFTISPKHLYKEPGNRLVKLEAQTDQGCYASNSIKFEFGDKPKAEFTWDNECYTINNIVNFQDQSSSISPISTYQWIFLDNDTASTDQNPQHHYASQDNHDVELRIFTAQGCSDTIRKTVRMRPTVILSDVNYFETFEDGENGWYPENDEETSLYSWEFGLPSGNDISAPDGGSYVWYTNIEDITQIEQSWVTSPCFDFSGLQRPMIKLNIARDMETNRNGVVIQSTTNNGQTWTNIGRPDEGINWYNSFEVNKGPGGQSSGWTGSAPSWTEARQHLEGLANKQNVRLRIAFSNDGNSLNQFDGFAMDNIWIGERTKNVLLEHFTNSDNNSSLIASDNIDDILAASSDIIPICYHTSFPGSDPLNQFYPAGPSARSLYYGITATPYAIVNGGYSGRLIFNQDVTSYDKTDIIVWSLYDPIFAIDVQSNISGNTYSINTTIEALENVQKEEIALRVAVIEKSVTLTNGSIEFNNVLRQMLPNAGGTVINTSWNAKDTRTDAFAWAVPSEVDINNIVAVVFLQNETTGEIYQVATDDTSFLQTGMFDKATPLASIQYVLYPNPAKDMAYILFSESTEYDYTIDIISSTGVLMSREKIFSSTKLHEIQLNNFRSGIYFIRISDTKGTTSTSRLLVLPD